MKRVLSLVSLIVIVGFLFVFAYPIAASSAISMKSDAIQETLDAYFEILYNKRANLLIGDQLSKGQQTLCTATFSEMDNYVTDYTSICLSDYGDELKFGQYSLENHYKVELKNASQARASAFVVCRFSYLSSPDIQSEYGLMYDIQLSLIGNQWTIISRNYPYILEEYFWSDGVISLSSARERYLYFVENYSANERTKTVEAESKLSYPAESSRMFYIYNGNQAASIALQYVAPTIQPDGTVVYSYPSGYHQRTHDCTNFVSFCMNYGGGCTQDFSGSYKWHTGATTSNDTWSWINVDKFYKYIMVGDEGNSGGGILANEIYSGNTFPSNTYINQLNRGDVVQFSSKGGGDDWTHTVIVSGFYNGAAKICGHSDSGYYSECALQTYYSSHASSSNTYYIRLITIDGYR